MATPNLRIPIVAAETAIQAKGQLLDCFAFVVLVKLTYGSSCIHNATIRRCKALFGIGTTKMSQILRYGLENGYLRREGNNIIANPLEVGKNEYMSRFNMPLRNVGKYRNHRCRYCLREVKDRLRQIVQINLVKLNQEISDAVKNIGKSRSMKVIQRSKKLLKRVPKSQKGVLTGLSAQRAAINMGVSKSKARKLIADAVSRGLLTRQDSAMRTKIYDGKYRQFHLSYYNDDDSDLPGYLFLWGNRVYLRRPPLYDITRKIKYHYHKGDARVRQKQYYAGYTFGIDSFSELEKSLNFQIPEF